MSVSVDLEIATKFLKIVKTIRPAEKDESVIAKAMGMETNDFIFVRTYSELLVLRSKAGMRSSARNLLSH